MFVMMSYILLYFRVGYCRHNYHKWLEKKGENTTKKLNNALCTVIKYTSLPLTHLSPPDC